MNTLNTVFVPNGLTAADLENARSEILREFYFRPKQFYRQFFSSLRDGILIDKISYLFKTKWI